MKQSMEKYFSQLKNKWKDFDNSLPKIPLNDKVNLTDKVNSFIYEGEVDKDGLICWNPVEKNIIHTFDIVEDALNITIHNSIKDYFNCYWFADFCIEYKLYNIDLEPVLPGIELNNFVRQLIGYKEAHNGELKNIPLGMDLLTGELLLVIDNKTGIVKLEDYETGEFKVLCNSLKDLILYTVNK